MSIETLTALAIFAIVTSVTPGPNNAMVLASGVHFGFRRTVPHMLGIALGYGFMLAIIGAGAAGRYAKHLSPARALRTYASLELAIALLAMP